MEVSLFHVKFVFCMGNFDPLSSQILDNNGILLIFRDSPSSLRTFVVGCDDNTELGRAVYVTV